jgi:hypothetical protein
MRALQTIVAAVPVRLMKRDFLFIAEQMLPLLDDKRLEMVARNRGMMRIFGSKGSEGACAADITGDPTNSESPKPSISERSMTCP